MVYRSYTTELHDLEVQLEDDFIQTLSVDRRYGHHRKPVRNV